jgi:hypothetical protein
MTHLFLQLYVNGKTELRKRKDISQVPKHYEIGPWKLNIILTQLRCFVSFSNYDLFQVNIVSDPSCREDSYHFFFDCSYYTNMKHTLFHNLSWLPNDCVIDLKLLTSGNPILSNEQNETIFEHMFEYIKRSERFLVVLYSSPREQSHTPSRPTPLSFLSSFSVFAQFTHINVRNIHIHACSIK